MPAAITAFRIARGTSRRGFSVSSPSAAAPSNPPNDRNASTMPRPSAERVTPLGSENTSLEYPAPGGCVPTPASFRKMTTIRITISVMEMPSIESSTRVTTFTSP